MDEPRANDRHGSDPFAALGDSITGSHDRRSFLRKAAVGGAIAWTAPALLSSPAAAQGSGNPIEFVAAGTEGASTTTSAVAGMPAGVQEGDLLIAAISSNGTSSMTAPTGWTEIGNNAVTYNIFTQSRLRVWQRDAVAGEPATVTFTRSNTGTLAQFRAAIVAYRYVSVATPTSASTTTTSGNGSTKTFPAVTSTLADSFILRVGMHANGTATWNAPPAGYIQRHESPSGDRGLIIFDSLQATPGSSGTVNVGLSATQSGVQYSGVINPLP